MESYCQTHNKIMPLKDVQTIQLPNLRYVHQGKCVDCNTLVWVTIDDWDIIINKAGRKTPRTVYAGIRTPKKLIEDHNGQTIIKGDRSIQTKPRDGVIVTVEDKKEESKNERT